MCVVCGADLPDRAAAACQDCGNRRDLVADAVAGGPDPQLGALHRRRHGLAKRWAIVVSFSQTSANLLLHNGKLLEVPLQEVPAAEPVESTGEALPALRSSVGRLLACATAVRTGAAQLPWSEEVLLTHAFGAVAAAPWSARSAAVDALTLGRSDLLPRFGLSPTETTWLSLITAARMGDVPTIVAATAALPPTRYRDKIAVVAAFVGDLRAVPGAASALASALNAFASSEPLAAVLQRVLGLQPGDGGQRLDDAAVLAKALSVPEPLWAVTRLSNAAEVGQAAASLLGPQGRLAFGTAVDARTCSSPLIWVGPPCPSSTT